MRSLHIQPPFELDLYNSNSNRSDSRLTLQDRRLFGNTIASSHETAWRANIPSHSDQWVNDVAPYRTL